MEAPHLHVGSTCLILPMSYRPKNLWDPAGMWSSIFSLPLFFSLFLSLFLSLSLSLFLSLSMSLSLSLCVTRYITYNCLSWFCLSCQYKDQRTSWIILGLPPWQKSGVTMSRGVQVTYGYRLTHRTLQSKCPHAQGAYCQKPHIQGTHLEHIDEKKNVFTSQRSANPRAAYLGEKQQLLGRLSSIPMESFLDLVGRTGLLE